MAKGFGQLQTLRGIIYYTLSPYEQRAFAGFIKKGFPNMVRRIRENIFTVCPPFIVGYLVYDWANKEHARLNRKNPADFADEV